MKLDSGRYLMHNAMRQPRSNRGFEKLDEAIKTYLDQKLTQLEKGEFAAKSK